MHEFRSTDFFRDPSASAARLGLDVKIVHLQPGLMVSLVASRADADIVAHAHNDHACVHCSCLLQGSIGVTFSGQDVRLNAGTLLTSYAPDEWFRMHLPRDHRNVEIMVTPEVLATLAGDDYDPIGDEVHRGFCMRGHGDGRRAQDAAARLARLIDDDRSPRLLLHAAALEFLAWHIETYRTADGCEAVSLRDRKRLMAARERLLRDLSNPPTIAELARETGLNQFKLKRGFKAVFGHSIYALFQRERMDRARELLQRHGVTETAMMMGYSNVSHFGAAFRKQFGVLPREARRGVLE
ncbi:helix-turn-helix transcriptional regulator [Rhodospira trueperi]|uniref:AraC family transcriptional regulator n=1 Tax=Rhodospira trueperi TaxID=69960 RepID=A0A1G7DJK7_9PROT|nr:AraC family transcriptional regulator [Rhodospira trueperi]SDE51230.1 AraC family transcriptional regulator [Rhodospira trueperi]